MALPTTSVTLAGKSVVALVDTGCTTSLVARGLLAAGRISGSRLVTLMDGRTARCAGPVPAQIVIGGMSLSAPFLLCSPMVNNFQCVVGMDIISRLGGVAIDGRGAVTFGSLPNPFAAAAVSCVNSSPSVVEVSSFQPSGEELSVVGGLPSDLEIGLSVGAPVLAVKESSGRSSVVASSVVGGLPSGVGLSVGLGVPVLAVEESSGRSSVGASSIGSGLPSDVGLSVEVPALAVEESLGRSSVVASSVVGGLPSDVGLSVEVPALAVEESLGRSSVVASSVVGGLHSDVDIGLSVGALELAVGESSGRSSVAVSSVVGGLHSDVDVGLLVGAPGLAVEESSGRSSVVASSVTGAWNGDVGLSAAALPSRDADGAIVAVSDDDFSASFDGTKWTVAWTWKNETELSSLHSQLSQYHISSPAVREAFQTELDEWIENGWLVLHDVTVHGAVCNIIPLMAVEQVNKAKVRPVMDLRQLNEFIPSYTGKSDVCSDTLRKWRRLGENVSLLDLRKAYLQLHVAPDLFRHQAVRIRGRIYCLTRLAFGMNVAPKIMSAVLAKVLSLDPRIMEATDNYIDDVIVDERIVSVDCVRAHLQRYGLVTKEPEPINGARVLGLHVAATNGRLRWSRDNILPSAADIPVSLSRRQLYSLTGRLVGHYPVGRWLRVACSYLKRQCNETPWDDPVNPDVLSTLSELLRRVTDQDPVHGSWCVPGGATHGTIWCDASSLALGACVVINGDTVEDAAWLRKDDAMHINVAELEAVVKGVNLSLKWGLSNLTIMTDSATVFGWLQASLTASHRIQTKGLAEMLVRRRLSLITELVEEYKLTVSVRLVPSAKNKADELTRVPKEWLQRFRPLPVNDADFCNVAVDAAGSVPTFAELKSLHDVHHLGVASSLFLARKKHPSATRRAVAEVVNACMQCQSIDPAPVVWHRGSLDVPDVWGRLAVDVTHYEGRQYLSIVDCGPSRFAIWRAVPNESAPTIAEHLDSVFAERGPPAECLFDNGKSFRSSCVARLLDRWGIRRRFRCAYRPQGNGIVERHHRTIKRMAARTRRSVRDMLFWYNHTPHHNNETPASMVFKYSTSLPGLEVGVDYEDSEFSSRFAVGDIVFVKPNADTRCTTVWSRGEVTAINSSTQIEVDGVPRHVADVRLLPTSRDTGASPWSSDPVEQAEPVEVMPTTAADECPIANEVEVRVHPTRDRRPPAYFVDFQLDI